MIKNWPIFDGMNCTINTTENCNLRCKYCYETCKTTRTITLETAYKFIDLIYDALDKNEDFLSLNGTEDKWIYDSIIWDFIGGDSLIDPELLDKLFTRINTRFGLMKNPLKKGWRASISSNGTLFEREDVRKFCEKWHKVLSLGVSIDGCQEIHDMNRVFPDGSGSMSKILEYWDWYRKWFPIESTTTKATCSKNTIPYLYDSLKFMHKNLGIKYINQNFIMEDMGLSDKDLIELDHQLELCCKYVLDNCDDIYWLILDHGKDYNNQESDYSDFNTTGRCGSGRMPCCAIDGRIYPCFRWLPHTQNGKDDVMCVGNVDEGFSHPENFVRVQKGSIRANCTKEEKCLSCEFEKDCSYCIGGCYAEYGDFIRTTHICEVTKLLCKWGKIYEQEYRKIKGLSEEEMVPWQS